MRTKVIFLGVGDGLAQNTRKAVQVGPGRASSPGTWFFLLSSACTEVTGDGSCQGAVLARCRQSMGLKGAVRPGSCLLHLLAGEGASGAVPAAAAALGELEAGRGCVVLQGVCSWTLPCRRERSPNTQYIVT